MRESGASRPALALCAPLSTEFRGTLTVGWGCPGAVESDWLCSAELEFSRLREPVRVLVSP